MKYELERRAAQARLSVVEGGAGGLPPIPFFRPDIGDAEIDSVVACLRSGWLTSGPAARQFEQDFEAFIGRSTAVAVSSGSAGLEVALAALHIGPGDEVITTDYTFTATALSILRVGARPVIVDIDPATFNICPERIEAAITDRTRAIMPVHFAGLPCDMKAILDIAARRGLKVIEDAAHALPAISGGRLIGQSGADATVFSFYATKTITTGEGGMITFQDPAVAARARMLRLHGIDRDAHLRDGEAGPSWRYEAVDAGFKANLSDILASIGIVQLRRAWGLHEQRARLWRTYDAAFADLPVQTPPTAPPGDVHALHLYALRLSPQAAVGRDAFIKGMLQHGIACSVHFIPLHAHAYWRDALGLKASDFDRAQAAFEAEVSLPLFPTMTTDEQNRIIACARRLLLGRP